MSAEIISIRTQSITLPQIRWQSSTIAATGLLLLGCLILPLDVPLAKIFLSDAVPKDIRAIFRRAEIFGHAYGVIAILVTIYLVDPIGRRRIPRLLLFSFGAGLCADLVKVCIWRTRPRSFDTDLSVWDSFVGSAFTRETSMQTLVNSSQHSTPSAHTAVAVAFAISLGQLYPKARFWFYFLAFLCAMNRIDGGAHFASDIFWGSAVACGWASLATRSRQIDSCLGRWERKKTNPTIQSPISKAA